MEAPTGCGPGHVPSLSARGIYVNSDQNLISTSAHEKRSFPPKALKWKVKNFFTRFCFSWVKIHFLVSHMIMTE
ncbi:hypothetical protein FF1_045608 [Malus domestica]